MPRKHPSTPPPAEDTGNADPAMQGEGNYTAARRHRKSVEAFVGSGQVEEAARQAEPVSSDEAREMQKAEEAGRSRAKG